MLIFMSFRSLVLCIVLVIVTTPSALPQAGTAPVSGTVKDQTSAVIPAASVTLTNKDTNITSRTTTNGSGFYLFPGMNPGPYLLAVEAPGMQKFEGSLTVQVERSAV